MIGGLKEHIRDLKEMILLPLLYPEVFSSKNITPPKGVLFCGPPGMPTARSWRGIVRGGCVEKGQLLGGGG